MKLITNLEPVIAEATFTSGLVTYNPRVAAFFLKMQRENQPFGNIEAEISLLIKVADRKEATRILKSLMAPRA